MSLVTDLQSQYTQSTGISFTSTDMFIDYIDILTDGNDDWDCFPGITRDQIIALYNYLDDQ